MYKFYYLKYLFIIIPGTLAGDWLLKYRTQHTFTRGDKNKPNTRLVSFLAFVIIVINVILLFGRHLFANLILTMVLCLLLYSCLQKKNKQHHEPLLAAFLKPVLICCCWGCFLKLLKEALKRILPPLAITWSLVDWPSLC
ncbi:DUF5009 domain-containing protein [Paraflavitalea speifideaquila]|uniref:DUF5009 domain-containing protein n=1 Tax=Paraflavitalea speifideaquila TaxID=3076558 RepID=UPI0033130812